MTELFEFDERFRKGGGKVSSSPPLGPKGKGEGSEPSQGDGKVPDPSKDLPLRHPNPNSRQGRNPVKETGLRKKLARVYLDLEEANAEVEATKPSADFYAMRFSNADTALRDAIAKREAVGEPRTLFHLYDARVAAGFAWNPHRKKLATAMSWRTALMTEAAALNKELGT